MKLKATTLTLILSALALGGLVYFLEGRDVSQRETAKAQQKQLFSFQEEQVRSLRIKTQSQVLEFTRSDQMPTQQPNRSKWLMTKPTQATATDASVAYLVNLLVKGVQENNGSNTSALKIPVAQASEFGFDPPFATVEAKLNTGKIHRLVLGKPNFNRSFLYAQIDPPASATQELAVLSVSIDFENVVNRPLSEWQDQDTNAKKQPPPTNQE